MQISTLDWSVPVAVLGIMLASLISNFGQPAFTRQPSNQSVSLGATAKLHVSATSTRPRTTLTILTLLEELEREL